MKVMTPSVGNPCGEKPQMLVLDQTSSIGLNFWFYQQVAGMPANGSRVAIAILQGTDNCFRRGLAADI
jgi:hypothetical protein